MVNQALATAASGATFQKEALDLEADNLSKSEVAGFRQQILVGASNGYYTERRPGVVNAENGALLPNGLQVGTGVRAQAVAHSMDREGLVKTDNQYHVAVQGRGYFQIELPDGTVGYTRDGIFTTDADGNLVTQEGYIVNPGIAVPQNTSFVTISRDGTVEAKVDGQVEPVNLGQIELATFINDEGLEKIEDNLLLETPSSGPPVVGVPGEENRGQLLQGWHLGSNVDTIRSVVKLISVQRGFEMNMKTIKAASEMEATQTQAVAA